MWLTLFFGGSIMPGLTEILLNSFDVNIKEALIQLLKLYII